MAAQGDKKSVGTTAVALASVEVQKFLSITNEDASTAVRIGASGVTASDGGRLLRAGESITVPIADGTSIDLGGLSVISLSGTVAVSWCSGG